MARCERLPDLLSRYVFEDYHESERTVGHYVEPDKDLDDAV